MLEKYLKISPEVKEALENNKPVVALESTIISHGMPYPENVETAILCEQMVRDNGAVPATIEEIPYALLHHITARITSEVKGISRVLMDITPKPVGTIEFE